MEYLSYIFYLLITRTIQALPLRVVYGFGSMLGWVGYYLAIPFRKVVYSNLHIAFGNEKTPEEISRIAKQHFICIGANILSCVKVATLTKDQLLKIVEVEHVERLQSALDKGKGVLLVLSHLGNWELFAQICQFLPQYKWGTIYRGLDNRFIEKDFCDIRAKHGVQLFDRKKGLKSAIHFLKSGGALGMLVDQHAGDNGLWIPFFSRLSSTSGLAGICALRTEATLIPIAIYTKGHARWKVAISEPIEKLDSHTTEDISIKINQAVEQQIRQSPADWFWVHKRWKTPKNKFLLCDHPHRITVEPLARIKPFRILIRSTNWLGDAVMTLPAVEAIANSRPDVEVTVLTHAKLADLWRSVPGVKHILSIDPNHKGVIEVAKLIRSAGPFDTSIVLPNSVRSAIEPWLAGVPRRVGYPSKWRRFFLNQLIKEKPAPKNGKLRHQRFYYLELARQIGANIENATLSLQPSPIPSDILEGKKPLKFALCPGAEYGSAKRWLPERFAEVARQIHQYNGCQWLLVGTKKDLPVGKEILNALGNDHTICENSMGKTSLSELIENLRSCQLLLTNDTGTMHLAAWLGVPVVAIFGSTEPGLTGPVSCSKDWTRIIRQKPDCSPCYLRECPIDFRCMKNVLVKEVVDAIIDLTKTTVEASTNIDINTNTNIKKV